MGSSPVDVIRVLVYLAPWVTATRGDLPPARATGPAEMTTESKTLVGDDELTALRARIGLAEPALLAG